MKIDIVSIFPQYFEVLDLSLIGKARQRELVSIDVHDLRSWTDDPHRSVDGPQAGGGPGMVMRPDVWGRALDTLVSSSPSPIIVIPTPTGRQFTQRDAESLARADHLIFACGRYEGIDQRVSEHYGTRVKVVEVSLGDYILNGGEVAAIAIIEALVRLIPGVVSNPESLSEESFCDTALLDYPAYTKPRVWKDREIPEVLRSGDHARITRWRREQQLRKTAQRAPHLLTGVHQVGTPAALSPADRDWLIRAGYLVRGSDIFTCELRAATPDDAGALHRVARETFPDACPPSLSTAEIDAFITAHLSVAAFERMLTDVRYRIWIASVESEIVGYVVAILDSRPTDDSEARNIRLRLAKDSRVAEISKCYLRAHYRGSGLAGALLRYSLGQLAALPTPVTLAWLGTNRSNVRAIRFYERVGWKVRGSREFLVGGQWQDDVLLTVNRLAKFPIDVAD
ncbi:MAG: tRNA (guanosine(37)-N1)-methyltransferase TrmD [Bowdeniella nasicola]|nr:tRNA (guanosine(37)-N1)-methyltransferase TrmD [Bowdeniella nasicola]